MDKLFDWLIPMLVVLAVWLSFMSLCGFIKEQLELPATMAKAGYIPTRLTGNEVIFWIKRDCEDAPQLHPVPHIAPEIKGF